MANEVFANPTVPGVPSAITTLKKEAKKGDTEIETNGTAPVALQGGQFRILIDTELMLVTAGSGTSKWTVTRKVEGSTEADHSVGAEVNHLLTAGAFGGKVDPAPTVPGLRSRASGYFGDGWDGALVFKTGSGSVSLGDSTTITGVSSVYTLPRDIYASSILIESGVTIITKSNRFLCTGLFKNEGTIEVEERTSLNGGSPTTATGGTAGGIAAGKGSLGSLYAGGKGAKAQVALVFGELNPINTEPVLGSAGGEGGRAAAETNKGGESASGLFTAAGARHNWLPLMSGIGLTGGGAGLAQLGGGTGGGGGAAVSETTGAGGGGGGAGGGLILILASIFDNKGLIAVPGGAGGTPNRAGQTGAKSSGGGAGGGGGAIVLIYQRLVNAGTEDTTTLNVTGTTPTTPVLWAAGGKGGKAQDTSAGAANGGNGLAGLIYKLQI